MSQDISNKTLALIMVIAIFVSLGGLFVSLDKLNILNLPVPAATGFLSSVGRVNVTIQAYTAIDVTDGLINFGVCQAPSAGLTVDSNQTSVPECTLNAFPDSLTIANIGNTYVNVSLSAALASNSASFIGGNNASLWFTSWNFTPSAQMTTGCKEQWDGCTNANACDCSQADPLNCTRVKGWTEIAAAATPYVICRNLSFDKATGANVSIWMRAFVPSDAPVRTNRNNTMTFTGTAVP